MKFSVILPAYRRFDVLERAIVQIESCEPKADEICVHFDGADAEVFKDWKTKHPNVRVWSSSDYIGPGGARNLLVQAARNEWVVNFDDDAWPLKRDFFLRLAERLTKYPDIAVLSFSNEEQDWVGDMPWLMGVAIGYACVFQRERFLKIGGFVPLRFAYCMEEVDFGLRAYAANEVMLLDPTIGVVHELVVRSRNADFQKKALLNTALFCFLRYPVCLWPLAFLVVMKRVLWAFSLTPQAVLWAVIEMPGYLWKWRRWRKVVSVKALLGWMWLMRNKQRVRFCG
jgi:glycosyltransferase involved in cell wall biosynthesis